MRLAHGSLFTSERRSKIVGAVRGGVFRFEAAEQAGVSERTLVRWMARGRESLEAFDREEVDELDDYANFVLDVLQAEAESNGEIVKEIRKASKGGDWRAGAWLLERRNPRRFGSASRVKIGIEGGDENAGERDYGAEILDRIDAMLENEGPGDGDGDGEGG